jgi:hypothetical protein
MLALLPAALFWIAPPSAAVVITNPDFDTNVDDWTDSPAGGTTSVLWNALDANGDPNSGSLRLETSDYFDGPQSDCVAITPLTDYDVRAMIYVPTQPNPPIATVAAVFYDNPDCTDGRQVIQQDFFNQPFDTWIDIGGLAVTFSTVTSARVWLFTDNSSPAGSRVVYFDDVRLELLPEPATAAAAFVTFATFALLKRRRTTGRGFSRRSRKLSSGRRSPGTRVPNQGKSFHATCGAARLLVVESGGKGPCAVQAFGAVDSSSEKAAHCAQSVPLRGTRRAAPDFSVRRDHRLGQRRQRGQRGRPGQLLRGQLRLGVVRLLDLEVRGDECPVRGTVEREGGVRPAGPLRHEDGQQRYLRRHHAERHSRQFHLHGQGRLRKQARNLRLIL